MSKEPKLCDCYTTMLGDKKSVTIYQSIKGTKVPEFDLSKDYK